MVNGSLQVTIENKDNVFIPSEDGKGKDNVGTFNQSTIQLIAGDKIELLRAFVQTENDKMYQQLEQLKAQLAPIADLPEFDEELDKHLKHAIQKGTKAFKEQVKKLNQRLLDLDRKRAIKAQVDYLENQLKDAKADLDELNKVCK